jgi:tetratricopeptide (TPR) repeat protein
MTHKNNTLAMLPSVFQNAGEAPVKGLTQPLRPDSTWIDSLAQLSLFLGQSIPETREDMESLLEQETLPERRAVLLASIARCYTSQMRLNQGASVLAAAWKELDKAIAPGDHACFVQLEMIRFLVIMGKTDSARLMLDRVLANTQSEYLLRLATYYRLADDLARAHSNPYEELKESAAWFLAKGHKAAYSSHMRMMAACALQDGDFALAHEIYEQAFAQVQSRDVQFCRALLHNDMAQLHAHQGQMTEAYEHLQQALALAEYPYSRIDSLDLKGRFMMQEQRYALAEAALAEGLNLALENGVVIIAPALALNLAKCHESLGHLGTARHFFVQASQSALQLFETGFPSTPTRVEAIRSALRLETQSACSTELPSLKAGRLLIAGETLKSMRLIFQNALLDHSSERLGSRHKVATTLSLTERSISNVRKRYREIGSPAASAQILRFVQSNTDLSWKKINLRFDDCLLLQLQEGMGEDRMAMSVELDLSYSRLSALLRAALDRQEVAASEGSSHETI